MGLYGVGVGDDGRRVRRGGAERGVGRVHAAPHHAAPRRGPRARAPARPGGRAACSHTIHAYKPILPYITRLKRAKTVMIRKIGKSRVD